MIKTIAQGLAIMAVGTLVAVWSCHANPPQPPPSEPTTAAIERYVDCYPKMDQVRGEYRAEVKRLELVHSNDAELARLRSAAFPTGTRPDQGPDHGAYRMYESRLDQLTHTPAMTTVFLPVLQTCGYVSVSQYAQEGDAVRWHAKTSVVARPYRLKLEGMLMQNLD